MKKIFVPIIMAATVFKWKLLICAWQKITIFQRFLRILKTLNTNCIWIRGDQPTSKTSFEILWFFDILGGLAQIWWKCGPKVQYFWRFISNAAKRPTWLKKIEITCLNESSDSLCIFAFLYWSDIDSHQY